MFVPSADKTNFDATYDLEELLLEEAPLEARARRQKPREKLKDDATEKEIREEELYKSIERDFQPFDYTIAAYNKYEPLQTRFYKDSANINFQDHGHAGRSRREQQPNRSQSPWPRRHDSRPGYECKYSSSGSAPERRRNLPTRACTEAHERPSKRPWSSSSWKAGPPTAIPYLVYQSSFATVWHASRVSHWWRTSDN